MITTAGCIRGLRERALFSRITGLGTTKREIKKMAASYCYFFRMELLLLGGVEAESELESDRYFQAGV